jgi:hypothetical protein
MARGFVSRVELPLAAFLGEDCPWVSCHNGLVPINSSGDRTCPTCSGTGSVGGLAADLFRRHPIEEVVVTDQRPENRTGLLTGAEPAWYWFRRRANRPDHSDGRAVGTALLPSGVFDAMPGGKDRYLGLPFPTEAAALAALSSALCEIGRERAGLPALAVQPAGNSPPGRGGP